MYIKALVIVCLSKAIPGCEQYLLDSFHRNGTSHSFVMRCPSRALNFSAVDAGPQQYWISICQNQMQIRNRLHGLTSHLRLINEHDIPKRNPACIISHHTCASPCHGVPCCKCRCGTRGGLKSCSLVVDCCSIQLCT